MLNNKSLKLNFIMNIILTGSAYIFPLITFPYISRILEATGNGRINFADSVVSYFIMIAMLGIPVYGIRACAKAKNDKEKLSETVYEIIILNLISTIASYVLLFLALNFVTKFEDYKPLILILSASIFLNCIGVEWLYKAFEEYSYITIRSLIFKIISIILMFLFVKSQEDIEIYAFIMVISSSLSYIFNFIKLRKYVLPFREVRKKLKYQKHIKPIFTFFLLSVSWTIYTNMDVIMLGFISTDQEVGYYSAALKIKNILVSGVSALGTVLLPRLTTYANNNKKEEFYELLKKDFSFIIIAAFFFIGFLAINAKETLIFLSGDGYIDATLAMQVIVFSIIFIGLSTMTGTNILIPTGREKVAIKANICGIIVNFFLNIILITSYGAAGAAMATLVGEMFIFLYEAYYLRNDLKKISNLKTLRNAFLSVLMAILIMLLVKYFIVDINVFILILLLGIIYSLVYLGVLLMFKESIVVSISNNVILFLRKLRDRLKLKIKSN